MSNTSELEKYEVVEKIGHGSFGVIHKVKRKSDGKILCRKEINYVKMASKEREQLHAEFSILSSLRHENIVQYFFRDHLRSSQELHIYMEYCGGGDLSRYIKDLRAKNQLAKEEFVWATFSQIVTALYRCHNGQDPPEVGTNAVGVAKDYRPSGLRTKNQLMILHRDLKPENIFLGEDNSVKLGDFGLSKLMASHDFASTYVGTPFYMSPEICAEERYTHLSDIWSLGCIMYELCARRPPFNARTHLELIRRIRIGQVDLLPSEYSPELQNVVKMCLNTNPQRRPDTATLLGLPQVRLMRKEREVVEIAKVMKTKEEQMIQRTAELDAKAATLQSAQSEQGKMRDDIEAIVRREWEVKARLEIDRQVQMKVERLQRTYEHDIEAEVQRRLRSLDSNFNSQPSSQNSSHSRRTTTSSVNAPFSSASTSVATDATDLSLLSIDSPSSSANADIMQPRKQARTPFTRARTQVYDSPMDVYMAEPSPMSIASLSLSPRRTAALMQHGSGAGTSSRNIFASALEQQQQQQQQQRREQKWKPLSSTSEDDETLDCDETDGLLDLPSPSARPFESATSIFLALTDNNSNASQRDPFKALGQVSSRPTSLLHRQNTAPSFPQRLQPQPSLFTMNKNGIASATGANSDSAISNAASPGVGPQAVASSPNKNGSPALGSGPGPAALSHTQQQPPPPATQATRVPGTNAAPMTSLPSVSASPHRRLSKFPIISEAGSPIHMRRAPPAPSSGKSNAAAMNGGLKLKQVLGSGDEMLRAVVQKNMNSRDVGIAGANAGSGGGRTLVELAQARAGGSIPRLQQQYRTEVNDENARPGAGTTVVSEDDVPIWDPERDEMPSPFIQRGKKIGLGLGFDLRR